MSSVQRAFAQKLSKWVGEKCLLHFYEPWVYRGQSKVYWFDGNSIFVGLAQKRLNSCFPVFVYIGNDFILSFLFFSDIMHRTYERIYKAITWMVCRNGIGKCWFIFKMAEKIVCTQVCTWDMFYWFFMLVSISAKSESCSSVGSSSVNFLINHNFINFPSS